MGRKRGTCAFCGDQDTWINEEHVWPNWLGRAIFGRMNQPQLRIMGSQRVGPKPVHSLRITAYCACMVNCNGGWMRTLENAIIPILKPMALDARNTIFDRERRALMAAWAVKTFMVYEFVNPQGIKYFTPEERFHVKTYKEPPPEDVRIWISTFQGTPQTHGGPSYSRPQRNILNPVAWTLTFTAGQFLMQAFACRQATWDDPRLHPRFDGVPDGLLIQVWPPTNALQLDHWPPLRFVNDDNLEAFVRRFRPDDYPAGQP